jgi:hypothetical protein
MELFDYDCGGELVVWLREQIDNLEYNAISEKLEELKLVEFRFETL